MGSCMETSSQQQWASDVPKALDGRKRRRRFGGGASGLAQLPLRNVRELRTRFLHPLRTPVVLFAPLMLEQSRELARLRSQMRDEVIERQNPHERTLLVQHRHAPTPIEHIRPRMASRSSSSDAVTSA